MLRGASGAIPGPRVLLAICLVVVGLVYRPVLGAYFYGDDFPNLLAAADTPLWRFLLTPYGEHSCLVRNLFLVASYRLFGLHAGPYFAGILLAHLVNVWLLFRVIAVLTGSAALAGAGALAWGVCPVHTETLGWYAVFGHVLVGTMLLVVLDGVVSRWTAGTSVSAGRAIGWYALLLTGVMTFGVGLAVAAVFPLALLLLRPPALPPGSDRRLLFAFATLPFAAAGLYLTVQWLAKTLLELPQLVPPAATQATVELVCTALGRLVVDALAVVPGGFVWQAFGRSPAVALGLAALALAGAGMTLVRGPAAHRRAALACLAFILAIYGLIAVARGAWHYGATPPGATAAAARYHYVGTMLTAIVWCLALGTVTGGGTAGARAVTMTMLVWLVIQAVAFARTGLPLSTHADALSFVDQTLAAIDRAVDRAAPQAPVSLVNTRVPATVMGYVLGHAAFPGAAAVHVVAHQSTTLRGHELRFLESDGFLRAEMQRRPSRYLARLLVRPPLPTEASLHCGRRVARAAARLGGELVACNLADPSGGGEACADRAVARYGARALPANDCPPCLRPAVLAERFRPYVPALAQLLGWRRSGAERGCVRPAARRLLRLVKGVLRCRYGLPGVAPESEERPCIDAARLADERTGQRLGGGCRGAGSAAHDFTWGALELLDDQLRCAATPQP